ncbi:MAG TPA: hypothetical protein VH309_13710, partial [Elusimicrobiota bacterium]|nr:hypothetical protein [Elusimicrobiota bacterium]
SRALSAEIDQTYRFDEDGNPIGKKAAPPKAKLKPSQDGSADKPACSDDSPCSDNKSSDADSL